MWDIAQILGVRYKQCVKHVSMALPDEHKGLAGLRIGQLSDFHRGPFVAENYIRRGAETLMEFAPDLIALTGDFVMRARHAESCACALSALEAPMGVYAVLGNHDYWSGDVAHVVSALEEQGIQVLVNDAVLVEHQSQPLMVAGVDDAWVGEPDIAKALAGRPAGVPVVLLSHAPDFAVTAAEHNVLLQLSGHSHGGQVQLPGPGPVLLPPFSRKYPCGLAYVPDSGTYVYTNVGLGSVFPPLRLNCPPEITVLTLETTEGAAATNDAEIS
jgi:predicted MPP superfamily phosphohydrolase